MRKQFMTAAVGYCLVVALGIVGLQNWDRSGEAPRPEGYQRPEAARTAEADAIQGGPVRVTRLDVADEVQKYLVGTLELVAMSPGSGWIKFNTTDGISPLISFDRVHLRDVEQFNRFARQTGEPIRVALHGDTLQVFAEETALHLARFEGKTLPPLRKIGFYRPKSGQDVQLALRRDESGRVYLVRTGEDPAPDTAVALKQP